MYNNGKELLALCRESNIPIWEAAILDEMEQTEASRTEIMERTSLALRVMQKSVEDPGEGRTMGGLIGGEYKKVKAYKEAGRTLSGEIANRAMMRALACSQCNASMGRICAAPTAGSSGILPAALITPLVLGATFGAAVIGAILTKNAESAARVAPLGNVVIRGFVTVVALALQFAVGLDPLLFAALPGDAVVMIHLAINAAVLVFGLPFSGLFARMLEGLLAPAKPEAVGPGRISALNPADLAHPRQAISNATREVLTVCEKSEVMLNWIFDLYENWDPKKMQRIADLDDEIDAIHRDIKFYLARISETALDEASAAQCQALLGTTIKIEQAADIISQNMLNRARTKHERNTTFSPEGWAELTAMHHEVVKNARLAFNLLVNRDVEHARQLVARKEAVRNLVRVSEEQHLQRLRNGNAASFESSSLHIDTMRDLKEINSLFASIGYPLLEDEGMLRRSRLL